jgi:ribosomal protein S18 acetylase RimI-like enzyme
MVNVTVRHATPDDVSDIRRIAQLGWTATYGKFLASEVIEWVMNEWYDTESVAQYVTDERVAYFVAEEIDEDENEETNIDEKVIGYASGGVPEDDCGNVGTLYVHPDRWGEGIGTRLFEAVLGTLDEWGAERVEIHVLAENDVGISFYESQGFECVNEGESEFGGTNHREYVYASDL